MKKISRYVRKIDYDLNNYLLQNLFNGAVYLIPKKDFEKIETSLRNNVDIADCHTTLLAQELFIVEDEPSHAYVRQADRFLVTIETTSNCNLQCSYCYENDKGTRDAISENVIADTLQYIENVFLRDSMHKSLCVGFIGGEPLLCKEQIVSICGKLTALGIRYNREISYHIDTNGTIPFDDLFQSLENLHISVSLTPRYDHNKNRCAKGFDSFDRVVSNLQKVTRKEGNTLSIRYNTNDENIVAFGSFVSFVKENIQICDLIEPMYTDEYDHTYFRNQLTVDTFRKWNATEAIDILIQNGFHIPYSLGGTWSPCVAYQAYSCKIYADGMVTMCDAMSHNEARCNISQICSAPELLDTYYSDIKDYNPLDDEECYKCVELARCMGKLFCRTDKCRYNKRFDDALLACTFTRYLLNGKGDFFTGML